MSAPPEKHGLSSDRLNTLGLNRRQLDQLLDARHSAGAQNDRKRTYVRWSYRNPSVAMSFLFQQGAPTVVRVAARDISCGGMSVLHSGFVYPSTPCRLILPCTSGESNQLKVSGSVVRCLHMQGRIHEIGVKFDKPIDAKLVLEHQLANEEFAMENVDTDKLTGRLVYAEDSDIDQRLFQHYLRGTQLRLKFAATPEAAVTEVCMGCDMFIADFHLEGGCVDTAIRQIRDRNTDVPIIVLSSDSPAEIRRRLDGAHVNAILQKPITAERLLRAIAEFIVLRSYVTNTGSKQLDRETEQLREQFYKGIQDTIDKIERSVTEQDAMGAYMTCLQIKATCASIGLDMLAKTAGAAAASLAGSMSVIESAEVIDALMSSCKLAKNAVANKGG